MKTIIIGERANADPINYHTITTQLGWKRGVWCPVQALLDGAFRGPRSRELLQAWGLNPTWTANVFPPGRDPKQWDAKVAAQMVFGIVSVVHCQPNIESNIIILMGRRVARAFADSHGVKMPAHFAINRLPTCSTGCCGLYYVHWPHPSGRNRAWNDEENHDRARHTASLLNELEMIPGG